MVPIKNETFHSDVVQLAPGNVSAVILYRDPSTEQVMMLHSGVTTLPKDEQSE
jgi:hypothetical protein